MPILGMRHSISDLYNRQMKDMKDYDLNINKRVFDMSRKQVATFDEDLLPQETQVTEGAKVVFSQAIESMTTALEKMDNLISIENSTQRKLSIDKVGRLMDLQPIIISYNTLMRVMKEPTLPRTARNIFENELQQIMPYLQQLSQRMYTLITHYIADDLNPTAPESARRGAPTARIQIVPQLISTYSVLELMIRNINGRIYDTVNIANVQNEFSKIIQRDFPEIKNIQKIQKQLTRDTQSLNAEKVKILENELGRKLTTEEKRQYINNLGTKVDFSPVFGERTRRALEETVNNVQQDIENAYQNMPEVQMNDNYLNQLETHLANMEDLIEQTQDEIANNPEFDDEAQDDLKTYEETAEQIREQIKKTTEANKIQKSRAHMNALNQMSQRGATALLTPPINPNPVGSGKPQKKIVAKPKPKKIYTQRKGNPFMSYNGEDNDIFIDVV